MTYEQLFYRMVKDGTISLRRQKAGAKVFDELLFVVNSAALKTAAPVLP